MDTLAELLELRVRVNDGVSVCVELRDPEAVKDWLEELDSEGVGVTLRLCVTDDDWVGLGVPLGLRVVDWVSVPDELCVSDGVSVIEAVCETLAVTVDEGEMVALAVDVVVPVVLAVGVSLELCVMDADCICDREPVALIVAEGVTEVERVPLADRVAVCDGVGEQAVFLAVTVTAGKVEFAIQLIPESLLKNDPVAKPKPGGARGGSLTTLTQ